MHIDFGVKPIWVDSLGGYRGSSPIDCVYYLGIPKGATIYYGPVGIYLGGSSPRQMQIFIPKGTAEIKLLGYKQLKR